MKVEIWSDLICPWCGIGQHRLAEALSRFGHADEVDVVHRSFQLDPYAEEDAVYDVRTMLQQKKGLSPAQVDMMTKRVEAIAAGDGITPYIVGDNQVGNTSLAHELAAYAATVGRGKEAWEALYRAYFGEARSIFDVDSLLAVAAEIGLDASAAREALTSRRFAAQVLNDQREAQQLGARGVPFIVVDRRYAAAGAEPAAELLAMLQAAWSERQAKMVTRSKEDAVCGPEWCAEPEGEAR